MRLTTALNTRRVLRRALLWERWPPASRQWVRDHRARALIAAHAALGGICVRRCEGRIEFTCRRRRVIVPAEGLEESGDLLRLVSHFHALFTSPGLDSPGDTLDLTQKVRLLGFDVLTSFDSVLEAAGMKDYNRHCPLKAGDVVFDCGSFHGLYALWASTRVGSGGRVYCFEPDEKNALVLRENLAANQVNNVTVVPKGIWNFDGRVAFSTLHNMCSCISDVRQSVPNTPTSFIDVVTISSFMREQGLERLDFVKMDIEGAEIEAVEGCLDYLAARGVSFGIASYHLRDGKETFRRLEGLFAGAGYHTVTEFAPTVTTFAWRPGGGPG